MMRRSYSGAGPERLCMPFPNDGDRASLDGDHIASFDRSERVSERVITSLAAVTGTEPTALDPLYDSIDPDALDRLVDHARDSDGTHEISFFHAGHEITVSSAGTIRIHPRR